MIKEKTRKVISGWPMLFIYLVTLFGAVALVIFAPLLLKVICGIWILIDIFLMVGFFFVNPNEARVLQLFGKYKGSTRQEGLLWANPLLYKKRISLRVRNFETGKMKVNDIDGNPIEIASIVVWKVVDTAEACFFNRRQWRRIRLRAIPLSHASHSSLRPGGFRWRTAS